MCWKMTQSELQPDLPALWAELEISSSEDQVVVMTTFPLSDLYFLSVSVWLEPWIIDSPHFYDNSTHSYQLIDLGVKSALHVPYFAITQHSPCGRTNDLMDRFVERINIIKTMIACRISPYIFNNKLWSATIYLKSFLSWDTYMNTYITISSTLLSPGLACTFARIQGHLYVLNVTVIDWGKTKKEIKKNLAICGRNDIWCP